MFPEIRPKGDSGQNAESVVVQSLLLPEGFFRVSRFFPLSLNGHFICSSLICFFSVSSQFSRTLLAS